MSRAHTKKITVQADDLDELNHVNNVRYVQWIQDVSKEHWLTSASSKLRLGIIWVVMHHDITYKNAAGLGDTIEIKTHIASSKGATSTRIVEMYHKVSGELLLRSKTLWCLLDAKTHRPKRISEEIRQVFL